MGGARGREAADDEDMSSNVQGY